MKLFGYDSWLFKGMKFIADCVLLNILFLVCCLPIFTIGDSITALVYCTMKRLKKEPLNVIQDFLQAFKVNFKQATLVWLILLPIGAILVFDWMFIAQLVQNTSAFIYTALTGVFTVIYLSVFFYVFAIVARYKNKPIDSIKYAFLLAAKSPFTTLLMFAISAAIVILFLWEPVTQMWGIIIFSSIGFALLASLFSVYFLTVFKKVEKPGEKDPDFNPYDENR